MHSIFKLMAHPWFRLINYPQFALALFIYLYMALSNAPSEVEMPPATLLHITGNFLFALSAWCIFGARITLKQLLIWLVPFSILIEVGQSFTDTRISDMHDIAANFAGIALASGVCFLLNKLRESGTKNE
ncbi:MAG: hypothetical protein COA42_10595 [Alteromonadaceae bacterium]|nr:MAG: hypothetical protein COA42_10595 [Alteromonadaceae bacterium]